VRPLLPVVAILAIAGAGCSGSDEPVPTPSATIAPTTTQATPSLIPTTEPPRPDPSAEDPDVRLPEGMPAIVDEADDLASIDAGDLTSLVPAGTSITSQVQAIGAVVGSGPVPNDEIAIAWVDEGPPEGSSGLIVWQRFDDGSWHAVYAFMDPPRKGVFGIRLDIGDVTRDAFADVLSLEDVGGSGACGTYRVIASSVDDASEIFRRDTCDTQIAIAGRDLRIREAVFRAGDPHCCPSAFRESTLRWNGTSWEKVSSEVVPNDPAGR
jgi:hypothetical protein